MRNKKKCYVIMPISTTKSCSKAKWTEIFEHLFKPAVEESGLGYECERSRAKRENIIKQILNELNTADVVMADLTDRNPNVFYELGVRHTLKNRTILIAQDEKFMPFDLKPYPTAIYNPRSPAGIDEFKREIKEKLQDIEANPERADNPVADFLTDRNISLLSYEKSQTLRKLTGLISQLSYNIASVDTILRGVKESEQRREKEGKRAFRVSNVRFDNACLELLVATQYIILPEELLKLIKSTNNLMRNNNNRLDLWRQESFAEGVEKTLKESLPTLKGKLTSLLREIAKVWGDYANDNYIEPEMPSVLLGSPEHEKYLETTK